MEDLKLFSVSTSHSLALTPSLQTMLTVVPRRHRSQEGLDEDLAATPEAQAAKDALQAATAAVEQAAGSEA